MHCYRVWFEDGTARLVDAESPDDARRLAVERARDDGFRGTGQQVREVEDLTATAT